MDHLPVSRNDGIVRTESFVRFQFDIANDETSKLSSLNRAKMHLNQFQDDKFSTNKLKWYNKRDLVVAIWFRVNVGMVIDWKRAIQTLYCSQKDGRSHLTKFMIGICPLATHS